MLTDHFDYSLPQELIAQTPIEPRDHSRLLVAHRAIDLIEHRYFYELGDYLRRGDLLVANESRVLPARLLGRKVPSGGKVEVLLLRPLPQPGDVGEPLTWEALVSPGRRIHDGTRLGFGDVKAGPYLEAEVASRAELGGRVLRFDEPPRPYLDRLGQMPLPPYIHESLGDPERYQTVYARTEGSAAAPTAGLHFTERLINELREQGIGFATVTLHVGLDTFRPVHEERIEDHPMHREWYSLSDSTAQLINHTRDSGGRIIAVGTTSVRVLETVARTQGISEGRRSRSPAEMASGANPKSEVGSAQGWTDLFITPGYTFGLVDALITNFHLPKTTLLMLVSALAGHDLLMRAYAEAIRERYRFYSFGDAMLIL
ncbi:MAG TPA: tRNA preQ1(34) S-adenosylmethionine ribosyltransferase-isomerase QueA [Chloroflexia bacterium]|nr:tRNA preQ1(34) S-adenosylmethionine ribosyltransferase-isomerase QueA [Chloroflexia bacterium]